MKKAYNSIIEKGRMLKGPYVVETDTKGNVVEWHKLVEEEPFVIWTGGTFELTDT